MRFFNDVVAKNTTWRITDYLNPSKLEILKSPVHSIFFKNIPKSWSNIEFYKFLTRHEAVVGPVFSSKISIDYEWNGPADYEESNLELKQEEYDKFRSSDYVITKNGYGYATFTNSISNEAFI